ncbi:uncharacterized protein LOC122093169 [Macadamia integrifolia]|uniref:uncharacterized protein LOC122093169 n=1 Tax=Macadamia integrifolia TaxID=60698 RepID=UPI001C532976|nr:uncharacterized protein LOC122093169 [Macadamia integrifolia]
MEKRRRGKRERRRERRRTVFLAAVYSFGCYCPAIASVDMGACKCLVLLTTRRSWLGLDSAEIWRAGLILVVCMHHENIKGILQLHLLRIREARTMVKDFRYEISGIEAEAETEVSWRLIGDEEKIWEWL